VKDRLSIVLGLAVALAAGFPLWITQVTAEEGRETVTVEMNICINPAVTADEDSWGTSDTIAPGDWVDGAVLTAEFVWRGDLGTLRLPRGELTYLRGRGFSAWECRVG
jgi:hypothetical protein